MKLEENFGTMTGQHSNELHLGELFSFDSQIVIDECFGQLQIKGLALDSRQVKGGYLFAALKGTQVDGVKFVADALESGAVAVLCDMDAQVEVPDDVCVIRHANPRRIFSLVVAKFFGAQPKVVAAVTGTNGKTSTVHFCRQMWQLLGKNTASVGTIGIFDNDGKFDFDRSNFLTTPDTVKLHNIISQLADKGVTNLAMEASSHGLDQYRLDGIRVNIGAFTNLSRDHLDYHGNFENYFNAKLRLFGEVMDEGGVAVLNADIPQIDKLIEVCEQRGHTVMTYGKYDPDADKRNYIEIFDISPLVDGQQISFEILGKVYNITSSLIGEFQAYNLLCALVVVVASGCNVDDAVDALSEVSCVPGRMEQVMGGDDVLPVFVDYAHTPDALEKSLEVLRPHVKGKLWVVFGCGGDRDKGKRVLMGQVAAKLADKVVVTDDNPRSEDPGAIRADIMQAFDEQGDVVEYGDRRLAIEYAIRNLAANDVLLVAGKGHERVQIIGDESIPFDDVDVVRELVSG